MFEKASRIPLVSAIGATVVLSASASVVAQPKTQAHPAQRASCYPSVGEMRKRAQEALTAHPAGGDDFLRQFDSAFGVDTATVPAFGAILPNEMSSDSLSVSVASPYPMFRRLAAEAIRKREPLSSVAVPTAVTVNVSPHQIDAPDIIKVILERDGKPISPTLNLLKPTTMTTRLGLKTVLHAGMVFFPCSAFLPGAAVTLTVIPNSGVNLVHDFTQPELLSFNLAPPARTMEAPASAFRVSGDLIGLQEGTVRRVIGEPKAIDGSRWSYLVLDTTLYLYFTEGRVSEVRPHDVPIGALKR